MSCISDYVNHPCVRQCEDGIPNRRCEYHWTLEMYYVLSKACYDCPFNLTDCSRPHCVPADGTSRGILTANRRIPGPGIQVSISINQSFKKNLHCSYVNFLKSVLDCETFTEAKWEYSCHSFSILLIISIITRRSKATSFRFIFQVDVFNLEPISRKWTHPKLCEQCLCSES